MVFLRRKVTLGRLHPEMFAVPLEDFAIDALADLFQQDESGSFIQIRTYFESIDIDNASDAELLAYVRRLVFSKVNAGLFRMYNEFDPGLGKILRNIKLSISSLQNFVVLDRFGETCIAPAMCETLEERPALERQELEVLLREHANGVTQIPSLLAAVARGLRDQSANARYVPIVLLAQVMRSYFARPEEIAATSGVDDHFAESDAVALIKEACRSVMRATERKYIEKKNVPLETFRTYFSVIEQKMTRSVVQQEGDGYSLFHGLREHYPDLTEQEYGRAHRSRIEYLGRLVQKEVASMLRNSS